MPTQSQHRAVLLLSIAQALANSYTSVVATISALTGQMLAADPRLATVPLGLQFVVTMAATIPVAHLMRLIGRRNAFFIGALIGAAGGALCMASVYQNSFILFCIGNGDTPGMQLLGLQLVNFDGHEPTRKQRVYRLLGGLVSAVAAGLGLIWALVDEERLAWHDHMSKTFPTFQAALDRRS